MDSYKHFAINRLQRLSAQLIEKKEGPEKRFSQMCPPEILLPRLFYN
jgi:hypothetical protein